MLSLGKSDITVLKKIDPKLVQYGIDLKKGAAEKVALIGKISKFRGKLKNIIRKIKAEKNDKKKEKLKVLGRVVRDELQEYERKYQKNREKRGKG